ncbi:MAG TPA: copper transporter [Trebonia sp.]
MIDFRYHLVSIVAVFLALAIGIVLGSTELQGTTLDALRGTTLSLKNQLAAVGAQRDSFEALSGASDTFLRTAEQRLVNGLLPGDRVVIVTEPGAPAGVISGVRQAASLSGATVTGTVALQPKFNDLSGATEANLSAISQEQAAADGSVLGTGAAAQTVYEQQAAQLIASAVVEPAAGAPGLTAVQAQTLLQAYAQGGYLTTSGTVTDRATLAVLVTPGTAPSDGTSDPADQVLLAVAQQFAAASAAAVVTGSVAGSAPAASAVSVLRSSSVSGQVSSVDNADTTLGQISAVWALASQLAGQKPNNYGISGASAVSPVPPPVPSVTPAASGTPTQKTTQKPTRKATGAAAETGVSK